jgi:tyrosyl-tRNA synthetase
MKLFTDINLSEISKYESISGAELNAAKILLADEATSLLHGKECLGDIHKRVSSQFKQHTNSLDFSLFDTLPTITSASKKIIYTDTGPEPGVDIAVALVMCSMSLTKSEARRLVKAGAVKVNFQKIEDSQFLITKSYFDEEGRVVLSVGKKKQAVFVVPLKFWP